MIKYFKKPYPLITDDGYLFPSLIDLLIGVIVFAVLFLFKPTLFFDPIPQYTVTNCLLFGLIAFAVAIIHTNVFPRIFPQFFKSDKWTIGKEFSFQASIVFVIAGTNYIAYILVFDNHFNFSSFIQMILSTLVVAFVPLMIVTIILQRHHFNKMIKGSGELNNVLESSNQNESNPTEIVISGDGKNEQIILTANQIIYIESSANYCDICYLEDKKLKKHTFRISLATVVSILEESDSFIKTHRSYIVNINHIKAVKGNAQGYQLTVAELEDITIPVSRANVGKLNKLIHT